MTTVKIEDLGGAGGAIVSECPNFNAAYHLANIVARCGLSFSALWVYEGDKLLNWKTCTKPWQNDW